MVYEFNFKESETFEPDFFDKFKRWCKNKGAMMFDSVEYGNNDYIERTIVVRDKENRIKETEIGSWMFKFSKRIGIRKPKGSFKKDDYLALYFD